MMKKILLLLAAAMLPLAVGAQSVESAGRASVGVDYKIQKGLHVQAEEEIRSSGNFESLGSLRTSLGITYKPVKYVKLGAGYTLINPYKASASAFNYPRHRIYADVTGYLPYGDFQFSLKERLQLTHRSGDFNTFQNTPNSVALKTRLGVKYKGLNKFVPSLAFEIRTVFNDPWGSTSGSELTNNSGKTYHAYTPTGYTHTYNDRYRLNLSGEVKFNKHHSLTPYVLLDFCGPYEIDTNSDGTRLFSAAYNDYTRISLGLSYVHSF